ncbi:Tripartite tricarboxylate transporter family receptor [compost metagenome]|jgi:tripartite-type tricarboxylate transporter receptor subunit TctC
MSPRRPWRRILEALCLTLAGAALPLAAHSQANYPDRPLRIIVPFTAGGSSDIQGRLLAEHLGKLYGQSVVVENRPGAGGHIGGKFVADSGPDGYTLLLGSIGLHATYGVYKTLNYKPAQDLKLITIVAEMPHVVVANPGLEANTLAELTALAKARPETLHFGSAGVGSSVHMVGELYKMAAQAPIVHIPYRGSSAATNDLLGGQIQLLFENVPTTIGYIQANKLKALAITGATRSPALPDVPTAAEAGLPGLTVTSWTTLAAGKDVPDALIEKISADLKRVYAEPAFRAGLERLGMTPVGNSPSEARDFVERERARWNKVIETEHITAG